MSNSVVKEIQLEVMSAECDILNALRKAHVIASMLNLNDFDSWIMDEMNGYNDYSKIPQYRSVNGMLMGFNPYRGWIPAVIENDEILSTLCNRKIFDSMSALLELYNNSKEETIDISYGGQIGAELNRLFKTSITMQFALKVGKHQLKQIIEHVKDCLLHWTIELEKAGIMGEGLNFTQQEKDIAKCTTTINNFYGHSNIINAPINVAQIVSGNNNEITIKYETPEELLIAIKESIGKENLTQEDRETATELVDDIESKVKEKRKSRIIKSALNALKEFLISVGASVTVALIQTGISIFG